MKTQNAQTVTVHHTTSQKVWGAIALAGLFVCGVMVGVAVNGGNRSGKQIAMSGAECKALSREIIATAQNGDAKIGMGNMPGSACTSDACVAKLNSLNEIYVKNCAGRVFEEEAPKPAPAPKAENSADKKTCEVIEDMLTHRLHDEMTSDEYAHRSNIDVYNRLVENGCAENVEKYQAMIQREQDILTALVGNNAVSENSQTCAEIERLLLETIRYCESAYDSQCHITNAQVYANISERGCAENRQKYVDAAARELEIARALQDDNFGDVDRGIISDTYKRIQMKQAAGEILNKVHQLADPAIDFIIQAQRIIEE